VKKKVTNFVMIYKQALFCLFTRSKIKLQLFAIFNELLYNNLIKRKDKEFLR